MGVELLSDITTADGRAIKRNIWKGIQDNTHNKFVHLFYEQERPGETCWSTWRKMLTQIYQCDDKGVFHTKKPAIVITTDWNWFYQPLTDRLYNKVPNGCIVRSRLTQRRNTRQRDYGMAKLEDITEDIGLPVTVYSIGDKVRIDGIGQNVMATTTTQTFWTDTILNHIKGNIQLLENSLRTKTILIMSDASVYDNRATAAWIITTEESFHND
jgi:hypothetical protein